MKKICILFVVLLFFSDLASQNADTVKIGAYISSLYNFDIGNNIINSDIHFWCLYNDSSYNFEKELEFIDCNEVNLSGTSIERIGSQLWFYTKAKIESRQKYYLKKYPFDEQKIRISLESSEHTYDECVFIPDSIGSKLDTAVYSSFEEWNIKNVRFSTSFTKFTLSFCSKKDSVNFDSYQTSINNPSGTNQKQISSWGICCVWNGVNDCVSPAVNCFDEIIVTPKNTEVLSAFRKFDSIAQLPDNSKQITAFFLSDESKKLFPDLFEKYPEYVYELRSGNNYIYRKKVGNKNYYIVRKNNDNFDNFVLQIKRLGNGNT